MIALTYRVRRPRRYPTAWMIAAKNRRRWFHAIPADLTDASAVMDQNAPHPDRPPHALSPQAAG